MRVSAKTDYAIRAALELAAAASNDKPLKGERIATAQAIPLRFLENILMQLRHAGLVESRRGAEGASGRGAHGPPRHRPPRLMRSSVRPRRRSAGAASLRLDRMSWTAFENSAETWL